MSGETIYSRAADVIRERGWWDGTDDCLNERGEPTHCLVTSLSLMARHHDWWDAVSDHLGTGAIAEWNDAPERTVEDVLMVLKELHVEAGGS